MTEVQVVVVFDMSAPDRAAAAEALSFVIGQDGLLDELRVRVMAVDPERRTYLQSWWFPEADLKEIDGNDNAAGRLVFDVAPADLLPAEKIALTVARAQISRGEDPTPNVAAVCVMALDRLASVSS